MSHYNNASLVEDSLELITSSSGLAVSTVINYGFWYSICKSTELISTLTGRFGLSGSDENELQQVRSSFCNQLAAIITSTEVALAGHISPWPLELPWWQPLRFVGTAYVGYQSYTHNNPNHATIETAAYFSHAVVARTLAGALTIRTLRHQDISTIQPLNFARIEYKMLSSIAGMMIGAIVYEKMLDRGLTPVKAAFAYMISASLTKTISAISSLLIVNSDSGHALVEEAGAVIAAGTGAIAGSMAVASSGAVATWHRSDLFLNIAAILTMALAIPEVGHIDGLIGLKAEVGMTVGLVLLQFLLQQRRELDSRHLMRNVAVTLAPALTLALINGVSNHAVYGYSLAESFTETARNQWQKFYDPLDYLHILFH
ncbi:hypothetical protein [Endozoicomonas sp. 8E]|uniref:hypothetical protein n=1 Tax=Endozoicomonas sp. 8E TaxID=3035692 RepID=UPI0029393C0C|nr:hypothetical protein [Endozoicomonas sp. 8E]WOG30100.1 hypothetical protein P6910_10725 [Endozoicomonas sp. 8E]